MFSRSRSWAAFHLFCAAGMYFVIFFVAGVESKVAWSSIDLFDNLISTEHENVRWNKLATAIQELKQWPKYSGPATKVDVNVKPPRLAKPWEELVDTALGVIEDVRVQLEPVDTDMEALDRASNLLQELKLGSVLDVIRALDTVDGYFTSFPKWIAGLTGLITYVETYEKNPMSVVFWMFGASLGRLTSGGETMVIWQTDHPYEILSMFSRLQLELMEAGVDIRKGSELAEALAIDFGNKEWLAFQEMITYCIHYAGAATRTISAIEAIMQTKGFKSPYQQSGLMYPIPKELEEFYEKYKGIPPEKRRMTLLEDVNTMSEIEAMRIDSLDTSSIWLDI
ncbi:hypothetical protein TWF225_000176 [Orbilia oligospora]|uniref:Uncharacterized protein n=1 Tax=Orbilia oligospora TaxID=2813651 RepID=A0A7C8PXP4_ORBOL|nr:hypothetical protein TWF751_004208 [Orbilia oligospora]KAF3195796.1 hypothetical protein TWF225_000176 [Orbilia oligospora]KAF3266374.1 hypothetical protein TWF128_010787 [Orbilia oligospora]KAF3297543.1 hypothetical protein TWF132_005967 [Orbilia oligospora]TGJ69956.1 hypothetical protein EYR41_005958 [Orbilia oligospora]